MQNAASQFFATRNGFGYVKSKSFIIKHVLIKKNPLKPVAGVGQQKSK